MNMKMIHLILILALVGGVCTAAEDTQPPGAAALQKRFNIDFPGGNPALLIEQIELQGKVQLNAIIPQEHGAFNLPPLKLRHVTVPELFEAITIASTKHDPAHGTTRYGFRTNDQPPHGNSIWYFFVEEPPPSPKQPDVCRFWQLGPYLENLVVEDITTAIETGWKMLRVSPVPKMSFHKDTKLLIVVGQPEQLTIVDEVLRQLAQPVPIDPATGLPVIMPRPNAARGNEKPSKR
jgi:hypothetical protein